jgi:hypothetical protein
MTHSTPGASYNRDLVFEFHGMTLLPVKAVSLQRSAISQNCLVAHPVSQTQTTSAWAMTAKQHGLRQRSRAKTRIFLG